MAEQVPFKHVVGGSNPSGLTDAGWCNGSTSLFGREDRGSNPCPAAHVCYNLPNMANESVHEYWWLKPPDFEVRCDAFVREVEEKVVPKYRDLVIDVENYTKAELNRLPRKIVLTKELGKMGRLLERVRRKDKRKDKWKEELSASENTAAIDIIGEGENSVIRIAKAIEDIVGLAEVYRGKRYDLPGYSIEEELTNPDHPGIRFQYIFS